MSELDRRNFFKTLIANGASVTTTLKGVPLAHREAGNPPNVRLYHGPMLIPPDVAEIIREDPDIHQCRGGGRKLAARYAEVDTTWLFRVRIPATRAMVGEIVRQADGRYRVHAWSAAAPSDTILDARELIARRNPESTPSTTPVMLPLLPPISQPSWRERECASGRSFHT